MMTLAHVGRPFHDQGSPLTPVYQGLHSSQVGMSPVESKEDHVSKLQMTPTHGHTGNEVTVCIRDERILERILATPGFPAPVSLPLYEGSTAWPIENRTIGHKGLGVVSSTRSVRADDLILAERPLMIAPLADATSWYNARYRENKIAANLAYFAEQERYFTAIVARMTPKKGMHSFRFATVSLSAAAPSLANFKRTASKFLHCLVIPRHRLQRITVILLQSANRRLASTTGSYSKIAVQLSINSWLNLPPVALQMSAQRSTSERLRSSSSPFATSSLVKSSQLRTVASAFRPSLAMSNLRNTDSSATASGVWTPDLRRHCLRSRRQSSLLDADCLTTKKLVKHCSRWHADATPWRRGSTCSMFGSSLRPLSWLC